MTTATLLERILSGGVNVVLTDRGTVKLTGDDEAVERWIPVVRARKAELVEQLSRQEQAGGAVSCWWRVRFADGGALDVFSPSGNTLEGIRRAYPAAVGVEPFELEVTAPDTSMTASERNAILAWLFDIDERAQEVIDEVMAVCERSAGAREYALYNSNKKTEKH
ncbi:MAG: hypothetical protein FWG52_05325 [Proteobacteria bacterium]|nr:hypothetical protein [Pseudomonadota bacterium]